MLPLQPTKTSHPKAAQGASRSTGQHSFSRGLQLHSLAQTLLCLPASARRHKTALPLHGATMAARTSRPPRPRPEEDRNPWQNPEHGPPEGRRAGRREVGGRWGGAGRGGAAERGTAEGEVVRGERWVCAAAASFLLAGAGSACPQRERGRSLGWERPARGQPAAGHGLPRP